MNLRRITTALGATAGALALALAPTAANAAAAGSVTVGGNTSGTSSFTGTGKTPITANIQDYGVVNCTSASATGTVTAGSPVPNPWASVSSFSIACPTIIPGMTVAIAVDGSKCPGGIKFSGANGTPVTTGLTDIITGVVDFGSLTAVPQTACIKVNFAGTACEFKLGGIGAFSFDESTQRLTISGTLTMGGVTGWACALTGAIKNGNTVALSVPMNISGPGTINFLP